MTVIASFAKKGVRVQWVGQQLSTTLGFRSSDLTKTFDLLCR